MFQAASPIRRRSPRDGHHLTGTAQRWHTRELIPGGRLRWRYGAGHGGQYTSSGTFSSDAGNGGPGGGGRSWQHTAARGGSGGDGGVPAAAAAEQLLQSMKPDMAVSPAVADLVGVLPTI